MTERVYFKINLIKYSQILALIFELHSTYVIIITIQHSLTRFWRCSRANVIISLSNLGVPFERFAPNV